MFIVKYNKPRQRQYNKSRAPKGASGQLVRLTLVPGVNKIEPALWQFFCPDYTNPTDAVPGLRKDLENGDVQVISVDIPDAPDIYLLAGMSVREAIDTVDGTYDVDTLEQWLQAENNYDSPRAGVLRKLKSQHTKVLGAVSPSTEE